MPEPSEQSQSGGQEEKQQMTLPKLTASSTLPSSLSSSMPPPPSSSSQSVDPPSPRSPLPPTTEQLLKPSSSSSALSAALDLSLPLASSVDSSLPSSSSPSSLASSSFDALRADFSAVLSELWHDKSAGSLERFRAEYDKLLAVIKKHQDNEKRLIGKCRELNGEVVQNAAKIQTALRLSFQDQANIAALKAEMEKAWKVVDAGAEKDKRNKEVIQALKAELTALQGSLHASQGVSESEQHEKAALQQHSAALQAQLDQLSQAQSEAQARVDELTSTVAALDAEKQRREKDVLLLKEKYALQKAETARHFRKCERLSSELLTLKEAGEKKAQAWNEHAKELQDAKNKREEMAMELSGLQQTLGQTAQDAAQLKQRYDEAEKLIFLFKDKELELYAVKEQMALDHKKLSKELKARDAELAAALKRIAAVEKEKAHIAQQRAEGERYKAWIKDEMKVVLKNMEAFRVNAESDEQLIRELQAQLKRMQTTLTATTERNTQQVQVLSAAEATRKQLEADVQSSKGAEQELRLHNYRLEKERERESLKSNGWFARCREKEEQIKLKAMEVHELHKALGEEKAKLRLQQTLYEQVRNDRNLFSRAQINSEDEINEMRRKFKIMAHQIEQLKEEIATKDAALINEHFNLKRLSEEQKLLKRRLNKRKEGLQRAEEIMSGQSIEIRNLRKVLHVSQQAELVHARQYEDVIAERDMIGSQLIRRNDELALLYEKVRIQQSVLRKGEEQYAERVRQLHERAREVAEVQRRLSIKIEEGRGLDLIRTEVRALQSALSVERSKVKALSEELENPMNVHRWRKLEGSDPVRFDLLHKVQTLQKRLIHQTELTAEAQQLHRDKDALYTQLKTMLARQPGPELVDTLSRYERGERDKAKQMRAMCAELNMLNAQLQRLTFDNERLDAERAELKRKLLDQRRLLQLRADGERREQLDASQGGGGAKDAFAAQQERFFATQPRIAGGGFTLQQPSAITAGHAS